MDQAIFLEENERVFMAGGRPASAQPLLLGITKSSLSTESFISAADSLRTMRRHTAPVIADGDWRQT